MKIFTLLFCFFIVLKTYGQSDNDFKWDLTYENLLKSNQIDSSKPIFYWNKTTRKIVPAQTILKQWNGD